MYAVPPTMLDPSASALTCCGEPLVVAEIHVVPVAAGQLPPSATHAIFSSESWLEDKGAVAVTDTAPPTKPVSADTVGAIHRGDGIRSDPSSCKYRCLCH